MYRNNYHRQNYGNGRHKQNYRNQISNRRLFPYLVGKHLLEPVRGLHSGTPFDPSQKFRPPPNNKCSSRY